MMNTEDYKEVHEAISSCRDGKTLPGLQEQLPHLAPLRLMECLEFLVHDGSVTKITLQGKARYLRRSVFKL